MGKAPVRELFQWCFLLGPPGSLRPVRLLLLTCGASSSRVLWFCAVDWGHPDSGRSPEGSEEAVSSLKSLCLACLFPIQGRSP